MEKKLNNGQKMEYIAGKMVKRKKSSPGKRYVVAYTDLMMGSHRGIVTADNMNAAYNIAVKRYGQGSIDDIYSMTEWKEKMAIRGKERRLGIRKFRGGRY